MRIPLFSKPTDFVNPVVKAQNSEQEQDLASIENFIYLLHMHLKKEIPGNVMDGFGDPYLLVFSMLEKEADKTLFCISKGLHCTVIESIMQNKEIQKAMRCSYIASFFQSSEERKTIERNQALLTRTHDPKLACLFLRNGVSFSNKKIQSLYLSAKIMGDRESQDFLLSKMKGSLPWDFEYEVHSSFDEQKNFVNGYGRGVPKKEYLSLRENVACMVASAFIRDDLVLDFREAQSETELNLSHLGDFRHWIAILANSKDRASFGEQRKEEATTPSGGDYAPYFKRFFEEVVPRSQQEAALKFPEIHFIGDEYHQAYTVIGTIEGEPIALTQHHSTNGWHHTDSKNISRILKHIDALKKDLKNSAGDLEEVTKIISQIHWWFAHAMPFSRGSAAIGEMIVKGLYKALGYEVEFHSKPDCEALITPSITEFQEHYSERILHITMDYRSVAESDLPHGPPRNGT